MLVKIVAVACQCDLGFGLVFANVVRWWPAVRLTVSLNKCERSGLRCDTAAVSVIV